MEKTNNVTQTFRGDVSISGTNLELKSSPKYFWKNEDGTNVIDGNVFRPIGAGVINIESNDTITNSIQCASNLLTGTQFATKVGESGDKLKTIDDKLQWVTSKSKKKKLTKSEKSLMKENIKKAIEREDTFSTISDDVYTKKHLKLAKDLLKTSGTYEPTTEYWMQPRPQHEVYYESTTSKLNREIDNIIEEKLLTKDDVNHPKHYNSEVFPQVIDMMLTTFSKDDVLAFCKLNSFKYRMRAGIKDSNKIEEDIKKAIWYENKYKELNQIESNVKQILKG